MLHALVEAQFYPAFRPFAICADERVVGFLTLAHALTSGCSRLISRHARRAFGVVRSRSHTRRHEEALPGIANPWLAMGQAWIKPNEWRFPLLPSEVRGEVLYMPYYLAHADDLRN